MDAEKTGMDADRSDSRESSQHLGSDFHSFEKSRPGRQHWLPERPLFQNEFPLSADSPTPVVLVYPRPSRKFPRPSRKFPRPSACLQFLVLPSGFAVWFCLPGFAFLVLALPISPKSSS